MNTRDLEIDESVEIPAAGAVLSGELTVPEEASGVVIFACGPASNHNSRRNRRVAARLRESRLGTLRLDLITAPGSPVRHEGPRERFDIEQLGRRLVAVKRWMEEQTDLRDRRVGLFGTRAGAAATFVAAGKLPREIDAIVSRGGRPDLAGDYLARVCSPTLLIVGGRDKACLNMNRQAMEQLKATKRMRIIPGASHLFEEPGKLETVAELTREWFCAYLGTPDRQV